MRSLNEHREELNEIAGAIATIVRFVAPTIADMIIDSTADKLITKSVTKGNQVTDTKDKEKIVIDVFNNLRKDSFLSSDKKIFNTIPKLEKKVLKSLKNDLVRYSNGKLRNLKTNEDVVRYLKEDVVPSIYKNVAARIWKNPTKYTLDKDAMTTLVEYAPLEKKVSKSTFDKIKKEIKKGVYKDVDSLKSALLLQSFMRQYI